MPIKRPLPTSKPQRIIPHLNKSKSPRRTFTTRHSSPPSQDSRSRLRRFNDRLPPFIRSYTTPLLGAPITHVTSFLILHEITAILPLFGLVAAFHYGNWLPDLTSGDYSGGTGAFDEGAKRFGRWLRRKGWVDDTDVDVLVAGGAQVEGQGPCAVNRQVPADNNGMQGGRKGVRLVLEFATAYAITKALLPVRVAASVWATPWFARTILVTVGKGVKKVLRKK